jgi:chromate transport protein ChrA
MTMLGIMAAAAIVAVPAVSLIIILIWSYEHVQELER